MVKLRTRQSGASGSAALESKILTNTLTPQIASREPAIPPAKASRMLSVKSCCNKRLRLAPIARRTAISLPRTEARASSRLATFTQAISRTRPTIPMRSRSGMR